LKLLKDFFFLKLYFKTKWTYILEVSKVRDLHETH